MRDSSLRGNSSNAIPDEYSYSFYSSRQLGHNLFDNLRDSHFAGSRMKHKPHRIRPRLNRDERILQIRHPAYLHPSHCLSCHLGAMQNPAEDPNHHWVLGTEYRVLGPISPRSASPGDAARINDSPTRNASYPAPRNRATSSGE